MRTAQFLSFLLTVLLTATPARAVTQVTTCGQTYSGDGELVADLDCSSYSGSAVVIDGGKLDLRGFRLTGAASASLTVECTADCSIASTPAGGVVYHSVGGPVVALSNIVVEAGLVFGGLVKAEDSTLDHVSGDVVRLERTTVNSTTSFNNAVDAGKARISDSSITASAGDGDCLYAATAKVERTTIASCPGSGIHAWGKGARVVDSSISDTGDDGIIVRWPGSKLRLFGTEISGSARSGIDAITCIVRDSEIHDNAAHGIACVERIGSVRTNVFNNGIHGVVLSGLLSAVSMKLRESSATGNGTAAECGVSVTCADIASPVPPRVSSDASCDTSYDTNSGFPGSSWGICSLD